MSGLGWKLVRRRTGALFWPDLRAVLSVCVLLRCSPLGDDWVGPQVIVELCPRVLAWPDEVL